MMKDKALEELFKSNTPKFYDSEAFMSRLNHRLEAVEYIKQYEEANIRRYKVCMLVAFLFGIVCGVGMILFLMNMPEQLPIIALEA